MLNLKAEKREGEKEGFIPAVLYGEGIKENKLLKVPQKEFNKVFKEAGESSLVSLNLAKEKFQVLIHQTSLDPLTDEVIHIDFFKPSTKKKVTAEIGIVFEGESPAVKDLGGHLLKEIQTIEIKGLVQNLPKEIKVDISSLENFDDKILVKDLNVPEEVEILRDEEDLVVLVSRPREEEEEEPLAEEEAEEIEEEAEEIEEKEAEEEPKKEE